MQAVHDLFYGLFLKRHKTTLFGTWFGKKPTLMTFNEQIEEARGEGAYGPDSLCVAVARLGADSQQIVAGTMKELADADLGGPLHSLVLAGNLHVVEEEMLKQYYLPQP